MFASWVNLSHRYDHVGSSGCWHCLFSDTTAIRPAIWPDNDEKKGFLGSLGDRKFNYAQNGRFPET
jgi:hypothetical protein